MTYHPFVNSYELFSSKQWHNQHQLICWIWELRTYLILNSSHRIYDKISFEIHVVQKRVQRWLKRISYYAISGHFGQINRTVRTFWLICYLYLTKYGLHYQFVPPSSFTKFRTRFHFKTYSYDFELERILIKWVIWPKWS